MTELFRAMLLWFKPRQRLGRLRGQNWDTIRRMAKERDAIPVGYVTDKAGRKWRVYKPGELGELAKY